MLQYQNSVNCIQRVFIIVLIVSLPLLAAVQGDRFPEIDVNLQFPADCYMHNHPDGRVIDVTQIPDHISDHDAYSDGTHVDQTTDALLDIYNWLVNKYKTTGNVSHHGHVTAFIIYFPNGTYLVNDQLIYSGDIWLRRNGHEDLNRMRFYGQSRAGVIIRLADNAPGFGDKNNPKAVISFTKHDRNNSISTNILQNMTIDLGKNNPGAIGVDFQGANMATVRNLTVTSADRQGYAGLRLPIWPTQGYYTDITVKGLDYGIDVVGGMVANGPVFENITLINQQKAGLHIQTTITPVRHLLVQNPKGPAVQMTTNTGHLVILDSRFENGTENHAAIEAPENCVSLYARNLEISDGFNNECIKIGSQVAHSGNLNGEFVAGEIKTLYDGQKKTSLNLPIEETPVMPYDPPEKWIGVESTGAVAGDTLDDTDALQKALDACDGQNKTTVYFRSAGEFIITNPLKVPAGVKRLIFMWGGRINTKFFQSNDTPHFKVADASDDPLIVEDYFQHVNGNPGVFIEHACTRTVICRNVRGSRDHSNYRHTSGNSDTKLFLENTMHFIGEGDKFDNTCWARWINTETAKKTEFLNSGGTFWVLGYKCEDDPVNFITNNGGHTEVLGGIINQYRGNPAGFDASYVFELDNASGSFIASASGPVEKEYETIIIEKRGEETRKLMRQDFPIREENKIHVPLFCGGE